MRRAALVRNRRLLKYGAGLTKYPLPPCICVVDKNEAFFAETKDFARFYADKGEKYDWDRAPSTPWQKQKRFKGRWLQSALGGFAGTSEMGWGFEAFGNWTNGTPPMYELGDPALPYVTPVRMHAYTIQQASAATSDQLRADPVFNHEPPEILSGNLQTGDIDVLLARGVPALSGPAGANQIGERFEGFENDLNLSAGVVNWPRKSEASRKGWRHSDIKDVALPFVRGVFETMKGAVPQ